MTEESKSYRLFKLLRLFQLVSIPVVIISFMAGVYQENGETTIINYAGKALAIIQLLQLFIVDPERHKHARNHAILNIIPNVTFVGLVIADFLFVNILSAGSGGNIQYDIMARVIMLGMYAFFILPNIGILIVDSKILAATASEK